MTLALIDGDIVAYRAAVANQRDFQWDSTTTSSVADEAAAIDAAIETVDAWAKLARCKDVMVAFTGSHNFRKLVLPTYKSNRKSKCKPLSLRAAQRAIEARWRTELVEGLEADDVLGILATTDKYRDAIVVSIDKDLKTIPGRHLNPLKDTKPRTVSERDADYWWFTQALIGDTTDGYAGCPRVGVVKAERALRGPDAAAWWPAVIAEFKQAGLGEVEALQQVRVARILRRQDYDKQTKEILLWHPTTPESLRLETVCGA